MQVFVTGISRGLGLGIARAALAAGARVWGCSRERPEGLLAEAGGRLEFFPLDLAEAQGGPERLRAALAAVDRFDLAYLNAGVLPPMADLADTPLETLRGTMEVNVWANKWILDVLFTGNRAVDQVVAISSGASVSGHRGWNGYGISKAALNMLVKLYAAERPGTHFCALAPGLVDTAMQDALCASPSDDRFPTLERLKEARGTPAMPDGATVGKRCWEVAPRLRAEPSGAYLDLRKIDLGH